MGTNIILKIIEDGEFEELLNFNEIDCEIDLQFNWYSYPSQIIKTLLEEPSNERYSVFELLDTYNELSILNTKQMSISNDFWLQLLKVIF